MRLCKAAAVFLESAPMPHLAGLSFVAALGLALVPPCGCRAAPVAGEFNWISDATKTELRGRLIAPDNYDSSTASWPTVVYLKNLAVARIGTESDESIISSFTRDGCIVATVDYAHH